MFIPVSSWFAAFALTLLVELPLVIVMLRAYQPNLARLGFLVVFANLATHLAVWYVATQLLEVGTSEYVIAAEAWAIAAEAVFYLAAFMRLSPARALAVSTVANVASFGVGRLFEGIWT
jgi:hypothetical protein